MAKAFRKQPDGSQVIGAWKREKEMRNVPEALRVCPFYHKIILYLTLKIFCKLNKF
jgi:hypothetical protein